MYIIKKIIASGLALAMVGSCAAAAFAFENSLKNYEYRVYDSIKSGSVEESSYISINDDCAVTISQEGHSQNETKFHTAYDYYIFEGSFTNKHKIVISEDTTRTVNIILDGYKFISDSSDLMWEFNGKCKVNVYLINGTENEITSTASSAHDLIKAAKGCTLSIYTFNDDISVPNDTDSSLPYIKDINDFGNGEKTVFKLTSNAESILVEGEIPSIIKADTINFTGDFEMDMVSDVTALLYANEINVYNNAVINIDCNANKAIIVHNYRQCGGEVLFGNENNGTLMYLDGEWSNFILTDGKFEGKTSGYVVEGDVVNQFSIMDGSVRMESTSKAVVYARRKLQDVYIDNGNVSMVTTAPAAVECQKPYFIPFSNGKAVIINGGNVHIVAEQYAFASTIKENGSVTYEKMDVYNIFGELVYQHRIDFENDKGVTFISENVEKTGLGYVLYNDRLMTNGLKLNLDNDYIDNGIYMWLNEPQENENDCLVFAGDDTSYTFKHVGTFADYMDKIDTVPALMRYDNSSLYIIFDRNGGQGGVDSITQISDNKLPKKIDSLPTQEHDVFVGYYVGDTKYYDENGNLLVDDNMKSGVVLKARWKSEFELEKVTLHVTFVLNGGESQFHSQYFDKDFFGDVTFTSEYVLPSPTKGDKNFLGWSFNADGSGELYKNESESLMNSEEFKKAAESGGEIKLYAIWEGETYTSSSVMYGDATCDGDINMQDVTSIQKVIALLTTSESLGENSAENSDVNHDGKITMEDVVLLQKYIAKLVSSLDKE